MHWPHITATKGNHILDNRDKTLSSSHNKKQHVTWLWVFVLSSILFLSTWMVQPLLLHLGHWDLLKWRSSHRTIQATTFDTRAAGPLAVPQIFNLTHPKTGSNNENNCDVQFENSEITLPGFHAVD